MANFTSERFYVDGNINPSVTGSFLTNGVDAIRSTGQVHTAAPNRNGGVNYTYQAVFSASPNGVLSIEVSEDNPWGDKQPSNFRVMGSQVVSGSQSEPVGFTFMHQSHAWSRICWVADAGSTGTVSMRMHLGSD